MIGNGSWLAIKTWQRMLKNIVIIKRCCQTIEKALGQQTQHYIDKLHLPGLAYELYIGPYSRPIGLPVVHYLLHEGALGLGEGALAPLLLRLETKHLHNYKGQ